MTARRAVAWFLLLMLPVAVFSNTIFARFGLRDDYAVLREAHDSTAIVTRVNGGQGRPIYGWMLQQSFSRLDGIGGLQWSRLLSALCIGMLGAATAATLVGQLGWRALDAWLVGAVIEVLPSAQILIGWGSCWPHIVAAILAVGAFALFEADGRVRGVRAAAAITLMVAGTLIYQSNTLYYLVLVAAGWCGRDERTSSAALGWVARHLLAVGAALALAYLITRLLFASGTFTASARVVFETEWLNKAIWFMRGPLLNALALLVLNDELGRTTVLHASAAGGVGCVLVWSAMREPTGRARGVALLVMVALLVGAFSVSLLAAERWPTYRTMLPLTAVVVVFVGGALRSRDGDARWRRRATSWLLGVMLLIGASVARWQAFTLIAEPQMQELAVLERGTRQIDPARHPRVFAITPKPEDSVAPLRWKDEFGSLSTDSDWTPKEIVRLLMRDRFPQRARIEETYSFDSSGEPPLDGGADVVIDLRPLRAARS